MPEPGAADALAGGTAAVRRPVGRRQVTSRDDIVNVSVDLVRREGFQALTVNQLAGELGIGRATLLRHVGSMGALRNAVALGLLRDDGLESDETLLDASTWEEAITNWALFIHRTCIASEALYQLLLVHPIVEGGVSPRLLVRIAELAVEQGVDLDAVAEVTGMSAQIAITLAGRAHAIRKAGPFDYFAERESSLAKLIDSAPNAAPLLARLISASPAARITRLEETVVVTSRALCAQVGNSRPAGC